MHKPEDIFPSGRMAAWFWFVAFCCLFLVNLVQPWMINNEYRRNAVCVVMDSSETYHIAPMQLYRQQNEMFLVHARHAAMVLLTRNAKGKTDYPELFPQLYLEYGQKCAKDFWAKEEKQFKSQQMTQKIRDQKIRVLGHQNEFETVVRLEGTLERRGVFKGDCVKYDDVDFSIRVVLVENPTIYEDGRLPFAVSYFIVDKWDTGLKPEPDKKKTGGKKT